MSPSDDPCPISALEMRDALAYCMKVVPKPDERPLLSFVAIVPEPERHRFLVTARNGNAWVGAYVEGDGMHRLALTHESAQFALQRLKAECAIQDCPRLVTDPLSRTTWFIASDTEGQDPVSIHLHEHFPRWDVRSKARPPLFPEGWRAPRVIPSLLMTPTLYSSDVMMLGAFWKGTCARWWVDVVSEFARIEFTRGDRMAAYAVVVPYGRKAGVTVPDARQEPIPGTREKAPPPTGGDTPALRAARELLGETAPGATDGANGDGTPDETPASVPETDAEPTIEDAPIPSDLSPALLGALRLAHAFRAATGRHELAEWTNKNVEASEVAERDAAAAFWTALELLSDEDRAVCTVVASDAEKLAATLADHPDPTAKRGRKKKGEGAQPSLPIEGASEPDPSPAAETASEPATDASPDANAATPSAAGLLLMLRINVFTWFELSAKWRDQLIAALASGPTKLDPVERGEWVEIGPVREIAIPWEFESLCSTLDIELDHQVIDEPTPSAPLSDDETAERVRREQALATEGSLDGNAVAAAADARSAEERELRDALAKWRDAPNGPGGAELTWDVDAARAHAADTLGDHATDALCREYGYPLFEEDPPTPPPPASFHEEPLGDDDDDALPPDAEPPAEPPKVLAMWRVERRKGSLAPWTQAGGHADRTNAADIMDRVLEECAIGEEVRLIEPDGTLAFETTKTKAAKRGGKSKAGQIPMAVPPTAKQIAAADGKVGTKGTKAKGPDFVKDDAAWLLHLRSLADEGAVAREYNSLSSKFNRAGVREMRRRQVLEELTRRTGNKDPDKLLAKLIARGGK